MTRSVVGDNNKEGQCVEWFDGTASKEQDII